MDHRTIDELNKAADSIREAADHLADKLVGPDVRSHLREAARHLLHAARSTLQSAEECLDKGWDATGRRQEGGGCGSTPAPEAQAETAKSSGS